MFVFSQHFTAQRFRWLCAIAWLLLCHVPVQFSAIAAPIPNTASDYIVRAFDTGDGLPQNTIISMVQTRDGYLWLGTINGLVRFDGIRFTVFDEENTPGLKSSPIMCLFEDSDRNLWIGTQTAGTIIMRDGRISFPGAGELSGGVEQRLVAACEDDVGAVWLFNANGDVWRHYQKELRRFTLPAGAGQPKSIIKETNGPVWVVATRGQFAIGPVEDNDSTDLPYTNSIAASLLDLLVPGKAGYWRLANLQIEKWKDTNKVEHESIKYPWLLSEREVTAACEDHDGSLLVGTKGAGLFRIGPDGHVTTNQGLSNNTILSLLVDREGTLWVGTDGGGLNRLKRRRFENVEEVQSWVVQSVCEDRQGGLWIGSHGSGFGYLKDGTLRRYVGEYVKTTFVDGAGRVWVGTRGFGLFQSQGEQFRPVNGNGLITSQVQAIHQDRHGTLWFGTLNGLVSWNEREWKRFGTQEGLTSDLITAVADDDAGDVWIGTRRGGLNRLREGQFTSFRKTDGLPSDDISSLLVDTNGTLWVATFSSGLARFKDGRWTRYTTRDGLISKYLGYLVEDDDGNLWIGSNAGVLRVAKRALNDFAEGSIKSIPCRAYGTGDGLPTFECTTGSQPGAWRGRDGKLWLPTIKGLVSVDPKKLSPNTNPPPVMIESVLIDDEPVAPGVGANDRAVTMRPGQEHLEIQFSSLNLGAPERARFRYRLEGYQKNWTEERNTRVAHYRKLEPGNYTFHVTACNEDEEWNETGSTLGVIVLTPFWKTWWFLGAAAVFLFGLVAGIVRYVSTQKLRRQLVILKQQEALEKERARIARDIHDQVGASLTQVALLGELVETDKDEPREVEAHARQISQAARETTRALDEIVWTVNPQNDTLEGLVIYICKYAQDYLAVAGVSYRFDIPAQLPALPIAPDVRHNVFLASKEAVTNIVRHAKAKAAWIRVRLEPSSFNLEIEDNGRGIAGLDPEAAFRRSGLKNMRKRMEDIGGTFDFGAGGEGGARVRFTVPLAPQNGADGNNSARG
ncbi:MAG TPA: two-component regulator propeller domain-containing protein [Candidatus Limnocylindria bacterium]|nr:two-component regulator propeller domain-containing protein [Candidatus Limnocylindria bacterium]